MTAARVRAIVGAPDDTLTRIDRALAPNTIVGEMWTFGTGGRHGAFPALGSVSFDRAGRVFTVTGGDDTPFTAVPEAPPATP